MINYTKTLNTPLTKQDKKNAADMTIIREYKKLMAKANDYKQSYIKLKDKNSSKLPDDLKSSLNRLTISEYNDALLYYNMAQDLKAKYPNIIK
mgnify:CR=1 FL=1|jgi:hypothetical protein